MTATIALLHERQGLQHALTDSHAQYYLLQQQHNVLWQLHQYQIQQNVEKGQRIWFLEQIFRQLSLNPDLMELEQGQDMFNGLEDDDRTIVDDFNNGENMWDM